MGVRMEDAADDWRQQHLAQTASAQWLAADAALISRTTVIDSHVRLHRVLDIAGVIDPAGGNQHLLRCILSGYRDVLWRHADSR